METGEAKFMIRNETDLAHAVLQTGEFCRSLGSRQGQDQMVATAVSELARNIIKYTAGGEVTVRCITQGESKAVEVIARDNGPGIENVEQAMRDHFSSSGTLGLGLPGVRRIMDEFEITSDPRRGTTVTVRKWL